MGEFPTSRSGAESGQRFRQMRTLQKFASVRSSVHNLFKSDRGLAIRQNFKLNRAAALAEWRELFAA